LFEFEICFVFIYHYTIYREYPCVVICILYKLSKVFKQVNDKEWTDIYFAQFSLPSRGYQQICSSVTGALITSLFMTPLDVVKTRLQVQDKMLLSNKCYLYCNGLMDHLCPCAPTSTNNIQKFNGTIVRRRHTIFLRYKPLPVNTNHICFILGCFYENWTN